MKMIYIVIGIYLGLFILLTITSKVSSYINCKSYSELTGRNIKYSLISGCYIQHGENYIPRAELEKRAIANE